MRKLRKGSLLFDVILYIIAAAVVIGGIYFSFSFLKGQADVNTLTNNDSKVMMDTATSFKTGFYDSKGKYQLLTAKTAKAWCPLEVTGTADGPSGSHYKSSKFDNECSYYIAAHDNYGNSSATTPTLNARYGIYIDCSVAKSNQNWSNEKTYQVELSFANAFKSRVSDAVVAGTQSTMPSITGVKWNMSSQPTEEAPESENADGILFIYNLHE